MKTPVIMEVCPRDGWQNLKEFIPFEKKIEYISGMLDAGIKKMQIGSFVHPKVVPQMADTGIITRTITEKYPSVELDVLIPNLKGAQLAKEAGLRFVSYVVSVSESHNKANIGRTHRQSMDELNEIMSRCEGMELTLSLATSFGCPFEGETSLDKVLEFVDRGVSLGVKTIELADTIGTGNPVQVALTFNTVRKNYPGIRLVAHMHDTRNNGIINSWTAAESGAEVIHTALGGLGGCPFAPGASGNTATEDFVWLLKRSGIETGLDCDALIALAKKMKSGISGIYSGHHINIVEDCFEKACKAEKQQ